MNLIRLLVIGLIVWLLYRMLQRMIQRPATQKQDEKRPITHIMVKCAHCGIHIPASEALCDNEVCYCSAAHREAGPGQHGE